MMLNEKLRNEE